jgi:hypothetical protein
MAQTLPNPVRAGQVLFAPVSRQERKGRKETKIPAASELASDVDVSA